MFDIGFMELLLVSVVGLLVLGPERLPGAVRTASLWMRRLRTSFNSIRNEIEREINVEEIKREIHNDSVMQSLKEAEQDLRGALDTTPYNLDGVIGDTSDTTGDPEPADESPTKGDQ